MPNRIKRWVLCTGLLAVGILMIGGSTSATELVQPRNTESPVYLEQVSFSAGSANAPHAASDLSSVGMGDLMSETFEFNFPSGWWAYDAISQSTGLDYYWGATVYTRAEGVYSGSAVRGGLDGAGLSDTGSYTAAVDAWMVYGPVSLDGVHEAQLDFAYLKPSASGALTVAIATDFDPTHLTGTFTGVALGPTTGWTTRTLSLTSYAGQDIYVAFRYRTPNGGNAANGPFVDDVHLRANYLTWLPMVSQWQLSISKTLSARTVWPGQSFVYSITVNNRGMADTPGVVISDVVPVSLTLVGADSGYSYTNRELSWHGLTVRAGESIVQHVTLTVPSGPSLGTVVLGDYAVSVPPNPMALYGPPVSIAVPFTFLDDFGDPASGWPVGDIDPAHSSCWPPPGSWRAAYLPAGAGYGVMTLCDRAAQLYQAPVNIADTTYFTIEADMRSNQADLWYSSYGIFFNGIETDLHEVYTAEFYQGQNPPEWDIRYWENFNWSDRIVPPAEILHWGTCWTCNGNDYAWNHMLVRRLNNVIEVWLGPGKGRNNLSRMAVVYKSSATGSQYNRAGFLHANFEWRGDAGPTPYPYVFDNFGLTPAVR